MAEVVDLGFTSDLQTDFARCAEGLKDAADENSRQYWCRMGFRAYFGFLEAWMSVNRRHLVPDLLEAKSGTLTQDQERDLALALMATDESEIRLKENGKGMVSERKVAFLPFMKAIIRLLYGLSGYSEE